MKKTSLLLLPILLTVILFNSCSTNVDLYADYKDITVVYGLLDSNADTNFVKINKAFLGPGNALDIALIADSCNYPYKLDAKIIEYRAPASGTNFQRTDTYPLDTVTVHNKELGTFYAPDQLVYYTKQKIKSNSNQYKYRYELQIDRGDSIINAITDIVGGSSFSILTGTLNLTSSNNNGIIKWYPCPNASVYEVVLRFHFTEVNQYNDSTERIMTWPLGSHPEASLTMEHGYYTVTFKASQFTVNLATMLGADTLNHNVERLIYEPSMEISVSAGGDELYNFITVNGPSSSIVQTIPEYTNVNGGFGVFSSRTALSKRVKLAGNTIPELTGHENWHFKQVK